MLGDSLAKSSLILEFSSDVPPSSFKPESNLDSEQDRNIILVWYLLPGVTRKKMDDLVFVLLDHRTNLLILNFHKMSNFFNLILKHCVNF